MGRDFGRLKSFTRRAACARSPLVAIAQGKPILERCRNSSGCAEKQPDGLDSAVEIFCVALFEPVDHTLIGRMAYLA
jgi:hypothetical protein